LISETDETDNTDALELLKLSFQERINQMLDLSLKIAEKYDDATTIKVIRAGLHSGEQSHSASSCEAINYLNDHLLVKKLSKIVEICYESAYAETISSHNRKNVKMTNLKEALSSWKDHSDPWLIEVITHWETNTNV
jgi:hypothetical protein